MKLFEIGTYSECHNDHAIYISVVATKLTTLLLLVKNNKIRKPMS